MSQENVEIARSAWEAWERGDLDGLFGLYTADVVWGLTHFREWPESEYRGTDGVRRFLDEWLEVWEDYHVGVEEIIAAPHDRVVCLGWQSGRGRTSGLAMDMKWAQILTLRDGRISRIENFDDRTKALEAAGLRE